MDFRSNPSLNDSILHHFIDVDDLLDFLLSSATQSSTSIVSDLLSRIASDVLRPIFAQLVRLLIIGKRSLAWENAEDFANAQSLVGHLSFCLRSRRRLSITFDSWPVEHTSPDLLQCSQIRSGSALLIPFDVPRGSSETLRQERILVHRCHSNRRERLAVQVHRIHSWHTATKEMFNPPAFDTPKGNFSSVIRLCRTVRFSPFSSSSR